MRWRCFGAALGLLVVGFVGCGSGEAPKTLSGSGGASGSGSGGASGSALDGGIRIDAASGDAANPCHRDVNLTAVKLGEPQPFDLVIVADHSESLSWSKDELSSGLRNLLVNIKGRSVRVFLLTPTQYGASSASAQVPLSGRSIVQWQDPATGEAYTNEMTTYAESCTDAAGASIACPNNMEQTPYSKQGNWRLKMPDPIATLRPEMTETEFAAQQQAVSDAILAIAGSGSPREQPLCTLSRYVSQEPALLPANVVFLIISDEDDVSTPSECLTGFSAGVRLYRTESGTSPCDSNCDIYRYRMTGDTLSVSLAIRCAAFDDLGNPIPGTESTRSLGRSHQADCTPGACTNIESQYAAGVCDQGHSVTSCQRTCTPDDILCTLDLTYAVADPCSQPFTLGATRYSGFAEFCSDRFSGSGWRDCSGGGLKIEYNEVLTGHHNPRQMMVGFTAADVGNFFTSRAPAAFRTGSYLLEAIVFDPAFSCTLGAGQSYATNLAAVVGDRSRLFPLCESYAPALAGVSTFAQTLIQTEFPLPLKDDENITLVMVIDSDGSERPLAEAQFSYDRATQTLTIERSSLRATDASLRLEVTSNCRPIPT